MSLYKTKRKLVGSLRVRRNVSFDPAIIEPFEDLCKKGGMSLSRAFEGIAEVFLKAMRPGEDFRREYVEMLSLYYNHRRSYDELPKELPADKVDL